MRKWIPTIYNPRAAFSAFLPSSFPSALSPSDNAIVSWSEAHISELKTLSIASALVAAVVSSTFSWSDINTAPWTVKASFYCALIFSIFAVGAATQQAVTLYNVGPSSIKNLHVYLQERRKWRRTHYVLSLPSRMLDLALGMFLLGLLILIYDRAAKKGVWGDDGKIAIVVSFAFAFALASHLVGAMFVWGNVRLGQCSFGAMFVWGMEKAMYGSESDGMDEQNAGPGG